MTNSYLNSISEIRKKLSFNHELIATIYHEAGHTISGLLNCMKIDLVCIELTEGKWQDKQQDKDLGYTNYQAAIDYSYVKDQKLFDYLIAGELYISYAGLAAEKLLYKDICGTDKIPMVLKQGSCGDRDKVTDLIKKFNLVIPGKKRHLYKKHAFIISSKQIEEHWDDVKLIARVLFKKKKLFYPELKSLLIKKSYHKDFWKQSFKKINVLFGPKQLDENKIKSILL